MQVPTQNPHAANRAGVSLRESRGLPGRCHRLTRFALTGRGKFMYTRTAVNNPASAPGQPRSGWIQLTKVRLTHPMGRHEHISHLGNHQGMWTREQIVAWIESGELGFYTSVHGNTATVYVRTNGVTKYVQTAADGVWNDNLLALPRG